MENIITEAQKNAILFCEEVLKIKFDGDIEDSEEVNSFLSKYFEKAAKANRMIVSNMLFNLFETY